MTTQRARKTTGSHGPPVARALDLIASPGQETGLSDHGNCPGQPISSVSHATWSDEREGGSAKVAALALKDRDSDKGEKLQHPDPTRKVSSMDYLFEPEQDKATPGTCNLHTVMKHCRKWGNEHASKCPCDHCADWAILHKAQDDLLNDINDGTFEFLYNADFVRENYGDLS